MVRFSCFVFCLLWTDSAVALLNKLQQSILRKISEDYAERHGSNLSAFTPQFLLYDKPSDTPFYTINWDEIDGPEPLDVRNWLMSISKLVVVIHGFKESSDSEWMQDMAKVLTADNETAVMLVDWRKGAQVKAAISFVKDYANAASCVPLMGATLSSLIQRLMTTYDFDEEQVECIGFSLGAQIGGYFTQNLVMDGIKIARFVALDAAAPLFIQQGIFPSKRNVKFLEAIHTSASDGALTKDAEGYLGIDRDFGHVDFYPNGGRRQPGCLEWAPTGCHHRRAHQLYLEALRKGKCKLRGAHCDSAEQALEQACDSEVSDEFYIGMPPAYCERGTPCIFNVPTRSRSPYCFGSYPEGSNEV